MNGDMDFKVAGTKAGITALQLDVKTLNLTLPILKEALTAAQKARLTILEVIEKALAGARQDVSQYAPKIKVLRIPKEKIGELIGPGGKNIRGIATETGAQVDVEEDGLVSISGSDADGVAKAVARVEALTKEAVPGEIYEGEVKRIQPFGAFVEIFPGKDGMVHVSDMSEGFVKNPEEVVKIGDKVKVRVKEIDSLGRVNLSMILDPTKEKPKSFAPRDNGRESSDRSRPRRYPSPHSGERRQGSGPHFAASKFVHPKKRY
jgi:polyribonucleotide nucleotidyltransferase